MIHWLTRRLEKAKENDEGFTLIELLVVITILGILAAITVFSVSGIGDKGKASAQDTDSVILRTAEEAYCAKNGVYGNMDALRGVNPTGPSFLATPPKYNGVVTLTGGACGNTSYTVGPSSFSGTTGPRFLAASNNTPGFSFLAPDFISNNSPIQFSFGSSGSLVTTANTPGDADVLFASADQANVDKVIPGANCTVTAGPPAVTCPGIAATKTKYATGRLVVFGCRAAGVALQPASGGSAQCKAGSGGFLGSNIPAGGTPATGATSAQVAAPTTAAEVVAMLAACGTCKVAIADPRNSTNPDVFPTTGGGAASIAPYGAAAYEALTCAAAIVGCGGLGAAGFATYVTSKQIVFGTSVTDTQAKVESGAVDVAFLPRSFVVSPQGNDTNAWTLIPQVDPTPTTGGVVHDPIDQYAVVLNHGTVADQNLAIAWLNYLKSATGVAVLQAHGYV